MSLADIRQVTTDLKKIYNAATEVETIQHLEDLAETWRGKYLYCVNSWEEKVGRFEHVL